MQEPDTEMIQKEGSLPEPRAEEGRVATLSEFLGCFSGLVKCVLQQWLCLHRCNFIKSIIELYGSKGGIVWRVIVF